MRSNTCVSLSKFFRTGIPNKRAELDKFPRSKVDEFIEYVLAFRTEEEATKAANELKEKIKISIEKK